MKMWLEVELDADNGDQTGAEVVYSVIDAVYHTPGVKSVVKCRNVFPTPPVVEEETRRQNERDRGRRERLALHCRPSVPRRRVKA